MVFLPREIMVQILLFSGHLVVLEGKLYPIHKITPERKQIIENILIQNPIETEWTPFNNLVKYVTLDITINEDKPKFYIISKYLSENLYNEDHPDNPYFVMITNTPYIYDDKWED